MALSRVICGNVEMKRKVALYVGNRKDFTMEPQKIGLSSLWNHRGENHVNFWGTYFRKRKLQQKPCRRICMHVLNKASGQKEKERRIVTNGVRGVTKAISADPARHGKHKGYEDREALRIRGESCRLWFQWSHVKDRMDGSKAGVQPESRLLHTPAHRWENISSLD